MVQTKTSTEGSTSAKHAADLDSPARADGAGHENRGAEGLRDDQVHRGTDRATVATEPQSTTAAPTTTAPTAAAPTTTAVRPQSDPAVVAKQRHEKFGGFHGGAAFFGWLVAMAMTVLLAGIVSAIATAVGSTLRVTQNEMERQAGTVGLSTGIALLAILMVGYFAGGYVAGRMARFDGGRQGLGVWALGLVVTGIVVLVGVVFGSQYDIFQEFTVPSIPIPTETLATGGLILFGAVVLGTLIAALLGGAAGRRYHRKIDRFGM